ncbi:hypothetical protein DL89DRAFT_264401 [Linderina pennispora]|uniref:MutS protein homolog 3 n=1 Tax=Linderina pennispora TaxID=61395 RepID=A0A1Y1WLW1_9FUNG|nr:uncharacterized protein DL89DRAFT_264401 [Linderina pennispora]ORX74561.1 hypothetical protein DL89DRAFT_264401 [Linderina pennispora]
MDVDEQLTIIAETPKKRARVISDDDMDDDYVDGQQALAGAKSRPPVARKSLNTQQATLVKSVSDTSDLAERMRERIRENGLSQGSGGMATGTVEGTSIQLVERKKGVKYTPLEMQVLDMKTKHPDILLAVEVGYKYRFFGEDARIASRVLGIMCTTANNFYNASIPTPRLMVHVRRLVETAALKAIGDNKSAPFTRELAEVFTAGTMVEEVEDYASGNGRIHDKYLFCAVESPERCANNGARIGVLAVQITTGDVIYDEFEDGYLRSELDTRLAHLQPSELVVPEGLSSETLKVLSAYCDQPIASSAGRVEPTLEQAQRTGARVAFSDPTLHDPPAAVQFVADFYAENHSGEMLGRVLDLPETIVMCVAQLVKYLEPFGLTQVFLNSTKQAFMPFRTPTAMHTLAVFTSGDTRKTDSAMELKSLLSPDSRLGSVHSAYVHGGDGSLFSVMDFTSSPFVDLNERIIAVEFLKGATADDPVKATVLRVKGALHRMVDLERGLCRIRYCAFLRSLDLAASLLSPGTEITGTTGILFQSGALHGRVQEFHTKIAQVESELEAHADSVAQGLGVKTFMFKSISGIDYLVDVTNVKARTVPDDWVKISSTKTNSRFHTPFIVRKLAERERYRELLASAANSAYSDFLGEITSNYEQLRRLVHTLATFDALLSLATLASRDGYTKPEIVDSNEAQISLTGARHPVLSSDSTKPYVPNDIALGGPARAVILTGPNMGGKSSLIRTVALVCVMAQCGSYVPAEAAKLSIIDAIFTRMGASDDLMAGESTFMVEMRETAELMRQATPNSLVILDELGRGTSTHDGAAIAVAVLDYLARRRPLTLFVTHYAHLVDEFAGSEQIRSFHMSFLERTADDGISQLTFLYKLVEGGSHDSYGLNVARMAGLPSSLLQCAKDKAEWMKLDIDSKLAVQTARRLTDVVAKARQNV